MDTIHNRVNALAGWFLEEVVKVRHGNGARVARIYGPLDQEMRGGTIALNVYDAQGGHLDHQRLEERANAWGISLRTGCFCNPGAGEMALGLERGEVLSCLSQSGDRMTMGEFQQCIDGKSTGAGGSVSLPVRTPWRRYSPPTPRHQPSRKVPGSGCIPALRIGLDGASSWEAPWKSGAMPRSLPLRDTI